MKLVIAGSRNVELSRDALANLIEDYFYPEIVNSILEGGCPTGADKAAREYRIHAGKSGCSFVAEWQRHGKAAGPLRNAEMAKAGDALLAIWDGESRGTKDMINKMLAAKKTTVIVFRADPW